MKTTNVLNRLKMELNNKNYFSDDEYELYLSENGLNSTDTYDKATMQRNLLLTVLDILESLSNDVDLMRRLDNPDILSLGEAFKYLDQQKQTIKNRIAAIPVPEDEYANSHISLFFTRG